MSGQKRSRGHSSCHLPRWPGGIFSSYRVPTERGHCQLRNAAFDGSGLFLPLQRNLFPWRGRPDKLASPAFKQVVWRLLASVGRSRSWHSLTQKYVLSASSLERCEAELYVQFQSKCFIFNVNVKTMTPAPIWKWFVVITLTLTGFVSSGADRDFVSGPKVHRCVFPLDGNRAVGQLLFFL